MATDAVRDEADNIMGSNRSPGGENIRTASHASLAAPQESQSQSQLQNQLPRAQPASMSYEWMTNDSVFSRDVDRWLAGDPGSPVLCDGVHPNRFATLQRATLAPTSSIQSTGFWMMAAVILPLLSLGRWRDWRCSPSTVLNTVELFHTQILGYCSHIRRLLRNMTSEQATMDIFAALMDIVLVVYAMGFLIISFYQASAFQQL